MQQESMKKKWRKTLNMEDHLSAALQGFIFSILMFFIFGQAYENNAILSSITDGVIFMFIILIGNYLFGNAFVPPEEK